TTGLLHIKEISESYIRSINDVFQVGQTIRAVIVNVDDARGRISLSTRVLEKSPGEFVNSPEVVFEEAEKRANFYRSRL
ncbi:MAG: S1 RNA-binding domain-containing protein, partial [Cyanobacteria bacterium J06648_11]